MSALLWLWMIVLADARVALQHADAAVQPGRHRVRVEPIGVAGELSPAVREALQARLGEALARTSFELVEQDDPHARLVHTQVVAHGRDLDIAIELVERSSARVIARVEEQCDTCGTVEAAETIGSLALALSRQADLQQRSAVQVVAPRAPIEAPPHPPGPPIAVRRPVRWGIGWAALATGAVGTGVGVALLALNGRPIARKCSGSNVDRDGTCRWTHSTMVSGAVIGTIGVGLLATGIALVVIESRRPVAPGLRAFLEHTPAWSRARALARR